MIRRHIKLALSPVLLLLLIPSSAAASGDLFYGRAWDAYMYNYYYWNTRIEMTMWDNYGNLDDDIGTTTAHVEANIPARNVNNTAYARAVFYEENPWTGWAQVDQQSDSSDLPGAGPGSVHLTKRTFIRYNWVGHPFYIELIYGGDDRDFQAFNGTARMWIHADVLNSAIDSGSWSYGPESGADLTTGYDHETSLTLGLFGGVLTQAAKDDWTWGGDKKLAWATADIDGGCTTPAHQGQSYGADTSTVTFSCHTYGSDPLVWLAPDIDVDFNVRLTFGNNSVAYDIEGDRDGFPSFEVYLNDHAVVQVHDNGDITSLFPPEDSHFHETGTIQ